MEYQGQFIQNKKYDIQTNAESKIVPICFALDEGYIMPTTVAVASLLKHVREGIKTHIFLLVPVGFDESKAETLLSLKEHPKAYRIEVVLISDARLNSQGTVGHITYPTFYRLIMEKFIPYDKVIYLDGDIIVNDDITGFYEYPKQDNYIAGVITPYSQLRKKDMKEAMERLGIDSYSKYVNAGVLVFNLKKIREDRMEDKFLALLDKDFPMRDQDILNCACYPKIEIVPCKYNTLKETLIYKDRALKEIYSEKDINDAREKPVVFHFADMYKPWKYHGQVMEREWMQVYSSLYDEPLEKEWYPFTVRWDRIKGLFEQYMHRK